MTRARRKQPPAAPGPARKRRRPPGPPWPSQGHKWRRRDAIEYSHWLATGARTARLLPNSPPCSYLPENGE
eukprot:scaffold382_cov380-Prasinococcus_capsulatus_cf.AAC.19